MTEQGRPNTSSSDLPPGTFLYQYPLREFHAKRALNSPISLVERMGLLFSSHNYSLLRVDVSGRQPASLLDFLETEYLNALRKIHELLPGEGSDKKRLSVFPFSESRRHGLYYALSPSSMMNRKEPLETLYKSSVQTLGPGIVVDLPVVYTLRDSVATSQHRLNVLVLQDMNWFLSS